VGPPNLRQNEPHNCCWSWAEQQMSWLHKGKGGLGL
jgi:hypothetical protein